MINTNAPRPNPFWGLVILTAGGFCVTILAYLASGLGSPAAPLNRFFDRYGFLLICIETGCILVTGFAALAVDRRQTLRHRRATPADDEPPADRGARREQ